MATLSPRTCTLTLVADHLWCQWRSATSAVRDSSTCCPLQLPLSKDSRLASASVTSQAKHCVGTPCSKRMAPNPHGLASSAIATCIPLPRYVSTSKVRVSGPIFPVKNAATQCRAWSNCLIHTHPGGAPLLPAVSAAHACCRNGRMAHIKAATWLARPAKDRTSFSLPTLLFSSFSVWS